LTDWVPKEHGRDRRGLQRRVVRGLTWTLIDTWGSQLLGLVIFAILAHLLQPEDFGLVALAAVFVALGQLFADQGLGDAVVQRPSLTRRQLDTVFWAAMATGSVLFVVGFVLAGPVARLVGEPRLEPILQVLSLVFPLVALSSIQMGLLRREMAFRGLAIRKLAAVATGGAVGVAMAFADFGAWALVGQQLASAVVSVVLLWAVSPWRPSFAFSAPDFRALFGYSINVAGGDFLGFLSRNMDNLLIGVFLGPFQLGLYAIAYRILDTSQQLLLAAARRLVFPSLARLQHDMERLRRAYMRVSQLSATVTLPSYLGLALVAPEAVTIIFGQKWAAAGVTASILFLIGPVQTIQSFSGAVWNAVGHPEITLRFRLVSTVTNVTGFLIAVLVFGDIVAVAAAYTIRGYALLPLNLYWMRRYVGLSIRELLLQLRGPTVAAMVMAAAVIAVKLAISETVHDAVLLAVEVLSGAVAFTVALFVVERPLLLEVVGIAAQAIPGGERLASRFGLPVLARGDVEPFTDVPPIGPDID
jgi:O-antigen/teichoic acid export membrane protein